MHASRDIAITDDHWQELDDLTSLDGSLVIQVRGRNFPISVDVPMLERISGSLVIETDRASLPALRHVVGNLVVAGNDASLPALEAVDGEVRFDGSDADLSALRTVGGDLLIGLDLQRWVRFRPNETPFLSLAMIQGGLHIEADGVILPALVEVTGDVKIHHAGTKASLPKLARIGGTLTIDAAGADLRSLAEVDRVHIYAVGATLPSLAKIGGEPFKHPAPEAVRQRMALIAIAALQTPDSLDWWNVHSSEARRSIAGWAVHLAGEEGTMLEQKLGVTNAGLFLLGVEACSRFSMKPDEAREWLRTWLPEPTSPGP